VRFGLVACLLIAAVTAAVAVAAEPLPVPRFSLSATTATVDDEVALRVAEAPRLQGEIRLFLVRRDVARTVRSRLDSRLSFVGSVRAARHARLVFTVPPLELGTYVLAHWCRGCLASGQAVRVQAAPTLRVDAPATEGCHATTPNGNAPRGAVGSPPWIFHGNGGLWVPLRPDRTLVTNPLGGYKLRWWAKDGVSGRLSVRYRPLDPPSAPLTARSGTFLGEDRQSTMSQMSFEPGCWQITGRLLDATLSFVVQVVRGSG
jgi:hypothetical protein